MDGERGSLHKRKRWVHDRDQETEMWVYLMDRRIPT
jgi:hypothetical protein